MGYIYQKLIAQLARCLSKFTSSLCRVHYYITSVVFRSTVLPYLVRPRSTSRSTIVYRSSFLASFSLLAPPHFTRGIIGLPSFVISLLPLRDCPAWPSIGSDKEKKKEGSHLFNFENPLNLPLSVSSLFFSFSLFSS